MSLSTRLTRAGLALLVFGVLSAVLPSTAATYAASNQCSSSSNNVSEADVAIGVVVVGGVTEHPR